MSPFISEAFFVGLKEGLKLFVVWLAFAALLKEKDRPGLRRPFHIGLALAASVFVFSLILPSGEPLRDFITKLTGYVFFLFFGLSVAALYQASGTDLLMGLKMGRRLGGGSPLAGAPGLSVLVAALTAIYFSPDIMGSAFFLSGLSLMRGSALPVWLSGAAGFAMPLAALMAAPLRERLSSALSPFIGVPQFFLFASIVKLFGGGVKGFSEFSLIPSVQRGLMKFFHDLVHQTFVYLMVPDHPMLKLTVWNFIGILFGSNIAMAVALLLLLVPPAIFLYHGLLSPITLKGEGEMTGAEKRTLKAAVRADRRKKSVPVFFFIGFILVSWYSVSGERASVLYDPAPRPVVEDKGLVIIPLTDPTMDLFDGKLHKFSLRAGEQTLRFLVIKKPDGKLAVCLDACEICPPEGYGQSEGRVVCIYCKTPIPIGTLGASGGCNPIPLSASVTERDIRIEVNEILLKWKDVQSGKIKEAAGEMER